MNDEEYPLFLQPSDRTAYLRRFEPLPGLDILNSQALGGLSRIASNRQYPFDR